MNAYVEKIQEALTAYAPAVLAALAVLVLGWFLVKILTGVVKRLLRKANTDETLSSFLGHLVYMAGMAFVIIAALGKLGISTASFAAVIAAAGLAIGFALQGSLGNFAAGVMLIAFRPFKAGDFIEAGGVAGVVEEVQIFATLLKTPDNKKVILGNAAVTGGNIINYSANDTRRVDMVFGIGYGDDLQQARGVIQGILEADERVLSDPEPVIAVLELGDNSVNFAVRPWVNTADYWGVHFDVTEKVKLAFDAQGISIPFPQRDVHLHNVA